MCKESTNGREEGEEGTAMGERKEDCTKGGGTGDREGEGKCHRRDTEGEKQEGRGETLRTVASVWMLKKSW